jgi:hypothetical protein
MCLYPSGPFEDGKIGKDEVNKNMYTTINGECVYIGVFFPSI